MLALILALAADVTAETRVYKTAGDRELPLVVYADDSAGPRPCVIFYFGGGWVGGSAGQFEPHARHLAGLGVVGITPTYRTKKSDGVQAVSCVEDAWDAYRYVLDHAEELGVDPARVAVGGGSAGGHLAACLGTGTYPPGMTKTDDPRPAAMLLFNPAVCIAPYDHVGTTYTPIGFEKGATEARVGCDPVALSPLHRVDADTPPVVVFHGTGDTTVGIESAELFVRAVEAEPALLHKYAGRGHGFFNKGRAKRGEYKDTLKRTEAFLVSLGWLPRD